jgi:hypothetical protein
LYQKSELSVRGIAYSNSADVVPEAAWQHIDGLPLDGYNTLSVSGFLSMRMTAWSHARDFATQNRAAG